MKDGLSDRQQRKLELAARAAWLYYIDGNTQDEIATKLNVSRPAAQRLVSLAVSEGLIKFRIDHPVAACVEMGERLRDRFALDYCEVVPFGPEGADPRQSLAVAAAEYIEGQLAAKAPMTMAFGTGRTLRSAVAQVTTMDRPQHKIVSLVGTMTRDGRASPYDVVMRLADRVGAQCYPLPTPVIAETAEEADLLRSQRPFLTVSELVRQARIAFVGVGDIGWNAPLRVDGFVTETELAELIESEAVGEICGTPFGADGTPVDAAMRRRLCAVPLSLLPERSLMAVAGGAAKTPAIKAVLRSGCLAGLITDEATAEAIMDG